MKTQIAALVFAALVAIPANAVIVTGAVTGGTAGGSFVKLTPVTGFAVGNDNQASNNLFAFDERQNFTLTNNQAVDIGTSPILKGTRVNSHMIVFDPVQSQSIQGNVTFATNVLGIITTGRGLIFSNYLGLPYVNYNIPDGFGIEPDLDRVWFNGKTVFVDLTDRRPGDEMRVLTAVPEPASWTMLVGGFGLIGAVMRRRHANRTIITA